MSGDDLWLLGAEDVGAALAGQEQTIIEVVGRAYRAHAAGQSSLPHSTFLRFPADESSRIIALPAYIGGDFRLAGVKWISSFPSNVRQGMARASAVIVLNSCETGRPEVILEGSQISAQRTAASAALAARVLLGGKPTPAVGFVGSGPINREIARYFGLVVPGFRRALVHDVDVDRAEGFATYLRGLTGFAEAEVEAIHELPLLLQSCPLVSFATNATRPYVSDLSLCPAGAVILHISLRDLSPEAILAADNVVDDTDHVCRAQTSVHLAEQATGTRSFIRCTLAEILDGKAVPRQNGAGAVVFSPFGLGILDIALAQYAFGLARSRGRGTRISSFLPAS